MRKLRTCFPLLVILATILLRAQTPNLEPRRPDNPAVPTVTYTFDWPSIQPHHYSIAVDSTGRAAYESLTAEGPPGQTVEAEPYKVEFTISEGTRNRIFDLAKQANYFNGAFDFKRHKIAFTGNKTLAFADGSKHFETSYNWSENPAIGELTQIFTAISNTQESARRLQQLRRFDKLGLNQELQYMEALSKNGGLGEVQAIAPLLKEIASDPAIMNIARERAQRLLQLAQR